MIAAAKALPVVGGVLDEQKDRVLAKQLCEGSRHGKSNCLLGHDVQPVSSFRSDSSVFSRIKGWAQSWILLVRGKTHSLRLHGRQANIARHNDARLTQAYGGGAL